MLRGRPSRIAALVFVVGCASHHAPPANRVTVPPPPPPTVAVGEPACDVHLGRVTSRPAKDGMVRVPSATLWMNDPKRCVHVRAFQIDRTEVTVAAYTKCFDAHACTDTNDTCTGCELPLHPSARDNRTGVRQRLPNHPVTCVNYVQAENYCAWMHKRLPTEEEWELAARGLEDDLQPPEPSCSRSGRVWDVGDDQSLRPLTDDVFGSPCPVGSFAADASPFGALDMTGNVREWTTTVAPTPERERGAFGGSPTLSVWHVTRGDSFINIGPRRGVDGVLRRSSVPAGLPERDIGFRCVRSD